MAFKDFFKSTGDYSLMRLCVFIIVLTGCGLAIVLSIIDTMKIGANLVNIGILSGGIITLGLGGKVLQKKDETKVEISQIVNPTDNTPTDTTSDN